MSLDKSAWKKTKNRKNIEKEPLEISVTSRPTGDWGAGVARFVGTLPEMGRNLPGVAGKSRSAEAGRSESSTSQAGLFLCKSWRISGKMYFQNAKQLWIVHMHGCKSIAGDPSNWLYKSQKSWWIQSPQDAPRACLLQRRATYSCRAAHNSPRRTTRIRQAYL